MGRSEVARCASVGVLRRGGLCGQLRQQSLQGIDDLRVGTSQKACGKLVQQTLDFIAGHTASLALTQGAVWLQSLQAAL